MTENLPDIYLFNPTCEYAVANGHTSWQPNRLLQKMEEDLGTLPLFFARPQDVILVKKMPPPDFTERLGRAGITPPRFVLLKEMATDTAFIQKPKGKLIPWGWSPAAHRLLRPLKPSCSQAFKNSPVAEWKPEYREIYSKKFALEVLKSILPGLPREKVLQPYELPEVCQTKQELETLLNRWGKLMVKAPWSSSGRGLQRVTKTPVAPKVWEKLLGIIKEQGYAMAEPYLEKVLDVAFQFEIKKGKIQFKGVSRFLTDKKGQYQGNFLNGWPDKGLEKIAPEVVSFASSLSNMLINPLINALENSLLARIYEGNFGVDTLIFRDTNDRLRVNPCLEINVRQNMGLLSLHLENLPSPGKKGVFNIFYQPGKSFYTFQKEMETNYPVQFAGNHIESGFFPLTLADNNTSFGAYLLVNR
jgi:hypothetical protein